jgi:hypothetical protein
MLMSATSPGVRLARPIWGRLVLIRAGVLGDGYSGYQWFSLPRRCCRGCTEIPPDFCNSVISKFNGFWGLAFLYEKQVIFGG